MKKFAKKIKNKFLKKKYEKAERKKPATVTTDKEGHYDIDGVSLDIEEFEVIVGSDANPDHSEDIVNKDA